MSEKTRRPESTKPTTSFKNATKTTGTNEGAEGDARMDGCRPRVMLRLPSQSPSPTGTTAFIVSFPFFPFFFLHPTSASCLSSNHEPRTQ